MQIKIEILDTKILEVYEVSTKKIKRNDLVVVDTTRGLEIGKVKLVLDNKLKTKTVKSIKRIASKEDLSKYNKNKIKAEEVLNKSKKIVTDFKLDMMLLKCRYTLDQSKLLYNFYSNNRVDFRKLLKEFAKVFKSRIELTQINERDRAKLIGGIGPCGLVLCCSSFLGEFTSISIKMAKVQNLSLNPAKISGVCNKLLCCLKYESHVYEELGKSMPKMNKIIKTPDGEQKVVHLDILKQIITTENKERKKSTYFLSELNGSS